MAEFEIPRFDDPLPVDQVIFAIHPVDSFTGGTVRGSVEARISYRERTESLLLVASATVRGHPAPRNGGGAVDGRYLN